MITFSNDASHLTVQGSTKAIIKASINIVGTGTKLPIEIVGEFKDIPPHLHQIYMQSMLGSYGDTNVYNNTKNEKPMTIKEKKSEWRLNRIVDILMGKR
jgi:hypothetical protein